MNFWRDLKIKIDVPVLIGEDLNLRHTAIMRWLLDNNIRSAGFKHSCCYYFLSEEDALLFSLTWL